MGGERFTRLGPKAISVDDIPKRWTWEEFLDLMNKDCGKFKGVPVYEIQDIFNPASHANEPYIEHLEAELRKYEDINQLAQTALKECFGGKQ